MKLIKPIVCLLALAISVFAQGDRGTITGTISDPAGAVVANAPIEAKNTQTGAVYPSQTTATGNYTLSQLPAGSYELSVAVPGFKKFIRQNVDVQVAQVLRLDIGLEVGAATESVTVTEAATLLKTESGELSHNVTSEKVNSLPILLSGAAAGSSGIRNPQAVAMLLPGVYVQPNSNMRVNGAPNNTASYRLEGQDASNGQVPATQAQVQPSIDAIQEVTIQTSNFAAEYGMVGGGFFNYTIKSGTNQLHGSAYDYWANEILNANAPWVNAKPRARRNNYGFTVGGPVVLPKIYDGHDKSFFFFNFEQFRENQNINTQTLTLPIDAYRNGNFARASTGRNLCPAATPNCDPLGRPLVEGTIYDPLTQRAAPDGRIIRDPFPSNMIQAARFDPVAVKVQSMIPATNLNTNLVNNSVFPYLSQRVTDIPTLKVDHSFSTNLKVSYFWQQTRTASQYSPTFGASDGLPLPITAAIGTFITAPAQRLNLDYTVTPTVLFHAGVGFQQNDFSDDAPVLDYNPEAALGLKGATVNRLFPNFTFPATQPQGGMKNMGPGGNRHPLLYQKPTANTSVTWVNGNHTYKFGGELRIDGNLSYLYTYTNGIYSFTGNETALPYLQTASTGGGTLGFPYASFLLGAVNSVRIANVNNIRVGKHMIGMFAQDSWKVTRKLTLDYGLRYDYMSYLREQYGRLAQFAPDIANPGAGGRLGAVQFEGDGQGRCNCSFGKTYPWAFAPRLGFAYQITPKTIFRGGWAIVYNATGDANGATQGGLTAPNAVEAPSFSEPVMNLRTGIPFAAPPFPNFDPGQYPQRGYDTRQAPPTWYDQNAGRPARQVQWTIGLQREFLRDLVAEASYVANRGVWWNSPALIDVNALTADRIAAAGLDINNAADRTLLNSQISSAAAAARGWGNRLPYSTFPRGATVAQSLRPFPQYSTITGIFSPVGKTWYDSLQVKVTKRLSHGLSVTSAFTWQKNLVLGSASNPVIPESRTGAYNDVLNRDTNKFLSAQDQPRVFNIAVNYTTPKLSLGNGMAGKTTSWIARDWTVGAFLQYASGLPILVPVAQNTLPLTNLLFRNTYANRVPGEPLFTQDLNCHCFDPNKEFVLNPKAWVNPPDGQFGTSAAYYNDYRQQRQPSENLAVGRTFRIREGMSLNVRAEFTNVVNRSRLPNPTSTNAAQTQTRNATTGAVTAGFGFINTAVAPTIPASRQGQLVARFVF
jgi:hypothetical protein